MSLRDELIQVAAVACAIIEDLDYGKADYYRHVDTVWTGRDTLYAVEDERLRQDGKWGPQHHTPVEWLMILLEEVGEAASLAVSEAYERNEHGRHCALAKKAAVLGAEAQIWQDDHEWPDPKHRAIHQGESR